MHITFKSNFPTFLSKFEIPGGQWRHTRVKMSVLGIFLYFYPLPLIVTSRAQIIMHIQFKTTLSKIYPYKSDMTS